MPSEEPWPEVYRNEEMAPDVIGVRFNGNGFDGYFYLSVERADHLREALKRELQVVDDD